MKQVEWKIKVERDVSTCRNINLRQQDNSTSEGNNRQNLLSDL